MAMSLDDIQGASVSGLVFSLIALALLGFMGYWIIRLEERLSRTIDDHGVVRKQFLPGEVFALPAISQPSAREGGRSDFRLEEIECQLSSALDLVKAMQQEIKGLEVKLVSTERLVRDHTIVPVTAGTTLPITAVAAVQMAAMPDDRDRGHSPYLQELKKPFPRTTSPSTAPEPVTFTRMPDPVRQTSTNPKDEFSLVADIGFTKESAVSKVFESGGHKMPPSLYVAPVGPPVAPVRAVSALPEPPGLDTTPSNARTPPVRGGGANFNAKGKNAQVPTTAEENDAGEDWDDLSNFETPPKTPWRSSHAIGGLQASAVKGPPSPTSSLASFTPSSRSTSKRPFGTNAPALSARGIHPEKHPELHAKELTEMRKLLESHCGDSADVVDRTSIRCLWCKDIILCPPYRPQNFFFKDTSTGGVHDGHFWTCQQNPNVTLQAGSGVNVGDGKVLI